MMRTHRLRVARGLVIAALTIPLLAAGTCLDIAQKSVVNGFFDAVTPLLVQQLQRQLGTTTTGGTPGSTTGNGPSAPTTAPSTPSGP